MQENLKLFESLDSRLGQLETYVVNIVISGIFLVYSLCSILRNGVDIGRQ